MRRRWRAASSPQPRACASAASASASARCSLQHGQEAGPGAEVRAVLADVGVSAGALGGGAQAVAAGQPGLDQRRVAPVPAGDGGQGQLGPVAGQHRAELGLGQGQCPLVFVADGGVEQPAIPQAHLRRDMSQQGHQGLQRAARVDQGGGIGVPELVRHHAVQARLGGRAVQLLAQRVRGDAAALVGEQEVGHLPGPRVAQRPARRAVRGDPVDDLDGLLVNRHHPLGEQLAQRDLQPGPGPGDLVHAVQLEVGQLADAHPGGPHQQQRVGTQPVRRGLQRGQQRSFLVGGQVAGQRVRQLGRIPREDQPPGRGLGPAPLGDGVQEAADGLDALLGGGGGDRRSGAVVDRDRDLVQVRLDVAPAVQQRQRGQVRVVAGEEPAEVRQLGRGALHRGAGVRALQPFQVGGHRPAHLRADPVQVAFPAPPAQRGALGRRLGRGAEVVDHRPGGVKRAVIVLQGTAQPCLPLGDCLAELVKVSVGQLAQWPPGLDQHADRDFGGHAGAGSHRVAQRLGAGQEALEVWPERAGRRLPQDHGQLAFQQVVIAGPQMAVQHQEVQQRLQLRAGAGQPGRQRQARPVLRVREPGQEAAGAAVEGVIAHAAGRQPAPVGVVDRGGLRRHRRLDRRHQRPACQARCRSRAAS